MFFYGKIWKNSHCLIIFADGKKNIYPEKTLAELYDSEKMPQDLREAHAQLDYIVESCYPGYPFPNDEERLECLFKLYEEMTRVEKNQIE